MKPTIREAALHLLGKLNYPVGTINAMPVTDSKGSRIRLLVAPSVLKRLDNIPKSFEGYKVVVEERGVVCTQ